MKDWSKAGVRIRLKSKPGEVCKCGPFSDLKIGRTYTTIEYTSRFGGEIVPTFSVIDDVGDTTVMISAYKGHFEEEEKVDFSRPLETHLGVPFTLLSVSARGDKPIIGYVGNNTTVTSYYSDGRYFDTVDSLADLRNVRVDPVVERYFNVYETSEGELFLGQYHYATVQASEDAPGWPAVGRVKLKVELVKGQFAT